MSRAVLDGIGQLLTAGNVGDYATDRDLTDGQVPITVGAMPAGGVEAIVLTTYGGPAPDSRNGWFYPRLQVRVRAADALAALDLDDACYQLLQEAHATLAPGVELTDCYALQSEPAPLGIDANDRHEYARNYQLSVETAG